MKNSHSWAVMKPALIILRGSVDGGGWGWGARLSSQTHFEPDQF